jgi:hypothetical protein
MKSIGFRALVLSMGVSILATPLMQAADGLRPGLEAQKPAAELREGDKPAAGSGKPVPFQGKVIAVDAASHTFTTGGRKSSRVFRVTDATQILSSNQQSEFGAIAVGELVRGQAYKRGDGWEAKKVMIGPKEEAAPADSSARK